MSVTRYIYSGPGMLVGERRGGSPSAYQLDGQGSTAGIVSEAGSRTDSFRFSMLGLQLSRTGSTGTPMQWLAAKGYTTIQGLTDPLYNPPLFGGDSGVPWDPTNLGSLLGKWVQEWLDNLLDGMNDLLNWLEDCLMSHDPWDCFGGDVHVVNFPPGLPRPMPPAHIPPPPGIPFPKPKPKPAPVQPSSPDHRRPCVPIGLPKILPILAEISLVTCIFGHAVDDINPTYGVVPSTAPEVPESPLEKIIVELPEKCSVRKFVDKVTEKAKIPVQIIDCFVKSYITSQGTGETAWWQMCSCSGGYAATEDQCEDCCLKLKEGGVPWYVSAWYQRCHQGCVDNANGW